MDTNELIDTRGNTHGDPANQFRTAREIKEFFRGIGSQHVNSNPLMTEALDMIAVKISRIMRGDPDFRDHWDDIAGYAKIVADRCSK